MKSGFRVWKEEPMKAEGLNDWMIEGLVNYLSPGRSIATKAQRLEERGAKLGRLEDKKFSA